MTDPLSRLNAALEGRYRVEREIGEGGMATVYLAHDERHNRNVALKVLRGGRRGRTIPRRDRDNCQADAPSHLAVVRLRRSRRLLVLRRALYRGRHASGQDRQGEAAIG